MPPSAFLLGAIISVLVVVMGRLFRLPVLTPRHTPMADERTKRLRRLAFSVTPNAPVDGQFDRAIAWCSRLWDESSSRLAETVLERLERDPRDSNAATTVANLMVRATETHMRASNWSAAPTSVLTDRYRDALHAASWLLHRAARADDHRGAHYSLALLLKLYPGLVAPDTPPTRAADAAAAHLCSSQHATLRTMADVSSASPSVAGRGAAIAARRCASIALVDDWTASPYVTIRPVTLRGLPPRVEVEDVYLAAVESAENHTVKIQGLDAVVHDIPIDDDINHDALSSRRISREGVEEDLVAERRVCRVYMGMSGCYPALWRQFGGAAVLPSPGGGGRGRARTGPSPGSDQERHVTARTIGLIDGFSGSSYYHWLLEGLPRLLFLADSLAEHPEPALPVFLPSGAPFVDDAIRTLPRELFGAFSVMHFRSPALTIHASRVYVPRVTRDAKRYSDLGAGAMLRPSRAAIYRLRAAFRLPRRSFLTRLVLVVRGAHEARSLGNQQALVAALATLATRHNIVLELFDGSNATLSQTVATFNAARLVVGVHGAGLANVVFCSPGAAVLELALPEPEFDEYKHLAAALNLKYAAANLPPSNFEARAWPRPSVVVAAADHLLTSIYRE